MSKYVRIVAKPTVDSQDTPPVYLDVAVNEEDEIARDNAIFGFQGDMNNKLGGGSLPFILDPRGKADFGEEYKSSERYGELDLREGKIFEGRILRFHGPGFDKKYRITEIITFIDSRTGAPAPSSP